MKIDSFQGDYRFLSNFWPVQIHYEGLVYLSVEHAYQAAKTVNRECRRAILTLTAGQARRMGRVVPIREGWENIKLEIMLELLRLKFKHPPLFKMLLDTGYAELIEGNTWGDYFWGVCRGVGDNHLGKLLMKVRTELRGDSDESVPYKP